MKPAEAKVYVVDDSEFMRVSLSAMLCGAGYKPPARFTSGDDLLRILEKTAIEEHPDLIVMDTQMPGTTGDRVCQIIRERYGERSIVVGISLEESAMKDDYKIIWTRAGAEAFIPKQAMAEDPDLLAREVTRVLEGR